ncbi:MAG: potassium-transporting ATPase subunit F [Chloroflexi bacterium]|nr:potassium-transporting ATPase subunit F [Chloroflexota bacterium]
MLTTERLVRALAVLLYLIYALLRPERF